MPAFGSGTLFGAGCVAFDVANTSDKDMIVAFNVDPGPDLVYAAQPQPFAVAPGQTERVEIALAASEALGHLPYHAIAPGRAVWSLATDVGGEPFRFEKTTALLPVAPLPMPSGPVPSVDGGLADWPALPYAVHRQGDVATARTAQTDIAFSFGVREAEGDVYFAVQVVDDDIVASSALGPLVQDGLLVVVDPRNEPQRSANTRRFEAGRRGHLSRMALGYLTLADAASDLSLHFLAESRAAVTWKTKRTATGYVAEAKVSSAFLNAQAGGAWQMLRIGVTPWIGMRTRCAIRFLGTWAVPAAQPCIGSRIASERRRWLARARSSAKNRPVERTREGAGRALAGTSQQHVPSGVTGERGSNGMVTIELLSGGLT